MSTSPELIVSVGTALGVLLIMHLDLRNRVSGVESWIWGHERANGDGADETHETLEEKIDHIDDQLEASRRQRSRAHDDVMNEIYINRISQLEAMESIIDVLNEEEDLSEVDIELEDVKPDRLTKNDVRYAQRDDK